MTTLLHAHSLARAGLILLALFCVIGGAWGGQPYTATMPEAWKPSLSLGQLTVIGDPFHGICCKTFGMCPVVRIEWSIENLTADPMYLEVNYRSPSPSGEGKTGYGIGYLLKPHEKRPIQDTVPVWTVRAPVTLAVYLIEMRLPGKRLLLSPAHIALQTDPLSPPPDPVADLAIANDGNGLYSVTSSRCVNGSAGGIAIEVSTKSLIAKQGSVDIDVSVGDPAKADWGATGVTPLNRSRGSYARKGVVLDPHAAVVERPPVDVPSDAGAKPLLVFRVSIPSEPPAQDVIARLHLTNAEVDRCQRGASLVYAGCIDLAKAAAAGKITLPRAVPVAERAKLISETPSEHFLFRYRPDSYAERNINSIVMSRESAYGKLRAMLRMDLPDMVTIDLYPDMEAKALGSGVAWTNANTVNNHQIAEVCNQTSQCDPNHELAHVFSMHFGDAGKGLNESFASYWEADTDIAAARERARLVLDSSAAKPLQESLAVPCDESWTFIHYLLKQNMPKFKQFYTRISSAETLTQAWLDDASRKVYGTDFAKIEEQWRAYVLGK